MNLIQPEDYHYGRTLKGAGIGGGRGEQSCRSPQLIAEVGRKETLLFFLNRHVAACAQWHKTNRQVYLQPPTELLEIFTIKVDGKLCSAMNEMFNFTALIGCVPWQKQMYFQNKIKHAVHLCKECNKWNWTSILTNNSNVKKVIKALPELCNQFTTSASLAHMQSLQVTSIYPDCKSAADWNPELWLICFFTIGHLPLLLWQNPRSGAKTTVRGSAAGLSVGMDKIGFRMMC